jgi:hypothetical protein
MRGGGGALTRSGLDDGYYWDAKRRQFTVEPLLPLAPKRVGGSAMGADAMSAPGYVPGRCSACGGRAEQSPVSDRWWHLGPVCMQASIFASPAIWQYGDGTIGPTDTTERPARFVEGTP